MKVIILTGARDRRHVKPCRATWKSTRVLRRQKTRVRERFRLQPFYCVSLGKARKDEEFWIG